MSIVSALMLTAAVLASDCGAVTSRVTDAASTEPSSRVTAAVASPTPTGTLGPRGYGSLTLGMSYSDALSTGRLQGTPQLGWAVKGHPHAQVCLTQAGGLMAIFGDATMATPEGIHLGSTLAQVKAAYPELKPGTEFNVPLSATTRYDFLIDAKHKKVYQWTLRTTTETCFD